MDTLAFGYVIPAIRAYSGLAPVRQCSCRAYYFSQIEQFSFDLAIEYLVDCYYPPGLGAFELSARAVQFFKTYTGKILRIWGNFRQKDFEEKNILCIFAPNCNINK